MLDPSSTLVERGHAPVNGLRMYYEVHGPREGVPGDGTPLVLLHGGGSTIEVTFSQVLPRFAAHRRVIALEEQAHGRTTDREGPVTFEGSADDVAVLLRHLKVERADLFGFSNGASIALQVALRHPALVRKLVFASSMSKRSGAPGAFWDYIHRTDFDEMPQSLKDAFLRVNPDPSKLRVMHDKDLARMRAFPDVPDERLREIQAPTLILSGDRDVATPEHAVELSRLIPQARLLILPSGHGEYLEQAETAGLVAAFLDAP